VAARATFTPELASAFARIALANVAREYPAKLDHVLADDGDLAPPRRLHPAFHGSFDWHSCVHMHWLLARVRRLVPGLPERVAIDAAFDRRLTAEAIAQECAYLARPGAEAFERTYGWAWLLALAHELRRAGDAVRWADALTPLARVFVARYVDFLPRQRYPIRSGLHQCSAFGLAFASDYARVAGERDLAARCGETALRWFGADRDAPAAWEPSGTDFLSCPGWNAASPPRCSRRSPSAIAPMAISCISTDSTCRARGACAASRARCRTAMRAPPRCGARRRSTSPPAWPGSGAASTWGSTGSPRSRCSR
jgi:hypothetical protein